MHIIITLNIHIMALWAPCRDPARTWTCVYKEACQKFNEPSCFSLSLCSSSSVLRACCSGSSNTLLKICCSGCCGNLSLLLVLSMIQHKLQKQQTTWAAWAMSVPKGSGSLGRNLPQPCYVLVTWLPFQGKGGGSPQISSLPTWTRHCKVRWSWSVVHSKHS